ncbi:hypothetical protein [Ferrimonas lipolytica]|uniref:Uncharacterized protein n=1 Tax=Ferrimonas lipolytica TaxID=2724191 RepID=A0A6H1UII9_9GAMM|nr:hypothetical protein [Ferrimonas lipolytica]QIZ78133.1 hypothetical protein HER31_15220 [Ferrimonas lipolytica]
MKQHDFAELLHHVEELSPSQREQLLNLLRFDGSSASKFLIENHPDTCPHCRSAECDFGVPHPKCERLRQSLEKLDSSISGRHDQIPA